ncbi:MAG: hypothetical protein JXR10_06710 [Cyclobacteriaceae bacterium]
MLKTAAGQSIATSRTPLASGGEGEVFDIIGQRDKVAKIYFPKNRTNDRFQKLSYMVQNPPLKGADQRFQRSVIWPEEILMDSKGNFVGYIMPKVSSGMELGYFTVFMRHPKVKSTTWDKLSFRSGPEFFFRRLVACYNLCKAIELIHSKKEYQLCDLKPSNILIDPTGFVSIIDLDSIQISSSKAKFPSALYTPEYTSPEFIKKQSLNRSVEYDHFSLAIILYQLLIGVHPFQGILKRDSEAVLTDCIKEGAFANGNRSGLLSNIPNAHQVFNYLPKEVQKAFVQTLDDGHKQPNRRLNATEWSRVFKTVIVRNQPQIKQNQSQFQKVNSQQNPAPIKKVKKAHQSIPPNPIRVPKVPLPIKQQPIIQRAGLPKAKGLINPIGGGSMVTPNKLIASTTPLVSKVNGLII